jgi:hypothetical protein
MNAPALNDRFKQGIEWLWRTYHADKHPPQTLAIDYWRMLSGIRLESLLRAVFKIPEKHPKFFPSVGDLKLFALEVQAKDTGSRTQRPTPEPFAQHVLADDNPFEQLARSMEREITERGLDPDRPAPRDLREQWSKQINELFGGEVIG